MIDLLLNDCGHQWNVAWAIVILCIGSTLLAMGSAYLSLGAAFYRGKAAGVREVADMMHEEMASVIWQEIERHAKAGRIIIVEDRPE